jgi:hypothetical protein
VRAAACVAVSHALACAWSSEVRGSGGSVLLASRTRISASRTRILASRTRLSATRTRILASRTRFSASWTRISREPDAICREPDAICRELDADLRKPDAEVGVVTEETPDAPVDACCAATAERASPDAARAGALSLALRLEYLTVAWNVVEGVVALGAARAAGSVALLGFGIDSFVETASGGILIWRLRAERRARDAAHVEWLDRVAHRGVGLSLFALAAYVLVDGSLALARREAPGTSLVGIAITSISIAVMWWLARRKRAAAKALGSRALEADAFQTTACWWLSLITLAGIGLNAALGWWWADPVAAIAMTWLLVQEGRGAWRGEECCG